jgi:hypothetical protein
MKRKLLLVALSIFLSTGACAPSSDVAIDPPASAPDADLGGSFATADAAVAPTVPSVPSPYVPPPDGDAAVPPDPEAGGDDAAQSGDDGGDPGIDAAPSDACATPLGPGDLVVDELMIASVAGTGDHGEWLEVRSTRGCTLDIVGLHGECPTGVKVVTFDQLDDLWIPPYGTFIVADSSNPAIEHDLPGPLVTWSGEPGDVLRNKGTTVTLSSNGVMIDALTYPALKLVVGASFAFPADCAPGSRSDFSLWQVSTASWFPSFLGTPNAPNEDVHCPQ